MDIADKTGFFDPVLSSPLELYVYAIAGCIVPASIFLRTKPSH